MSKGLIKLLKAHPKLIAEHREFVVRKVLEIQAKRVKTS
jgi:hypothetical protein